MNMAETTVRMNECSETWSAPVPSTRRKPVPIRVEAPPHGIIPPRRAPHAGLGPHALPALVTGREGAPHFPDAGATGRQHAVLQAVEVLAVNGRNELARNQAEEDARGEVVLADALGHLKILVEHGVEGKGDGL